SGNPVQVARPRPCTARAPRPRVTHQSTMDRRAASRTDIGDTVRTDRPPALAQPCHRGPACVIKPATRLDPTTDDEQASMIHRYTAWRNRNTDNPRLRRITPKGKRGLTRH